MDDLIKDTIRELTTRIDILKYKKTYREPSFITYADKKISHIGKLIIGLKELENAKG